MGERKVDGRKLRVSEVCRRLSVVHRSAVKAAKAPRAAQLLEGP